MNLAEALEFCASADAAPAAPGAYHRVVLAAVAQQVEHGEPVGIAGDVV